jgi:two-component system chemotaxis response regulator CheB
MTTTDPAIRALLVESSPLDRTQLILLLQRDGDITVIGEAATGAEAVGIFARTKPDVVILNLHLEDGSSHHAIEQIMAHTPTPILVLSATLDDRGSPGAMEALVAGAADLLPTCRGWIAELGVELRRAVRQIHKIRVIRHPRRRLNSTPRHRRDRHPEQHPVVAMAASTGGPAALATLLAGLAGLPAPMLIVQHLHPEFTNRLVEWMARISPLPVTTAEHGQIPRAGCIYVAPSKMHLRVGPSLRLELGPEPESPHLPSADQLFLSVAEQAGAAAVGVLLTGIGDDGARGLLEIHRRGGQTLAQDEATCAVFGMPQAARRIGAVTDLKPVTQLAAAINQAVRKVRA